MIEKVNRVTTSIVLAILILSLGVVQVLAQDAKLNKEPIQFGTNYYEFVRSNGITWFAANAAASGKSYKGVSGHLAAITSAEENEFVRGAFSSGSSKPEGAWLGGKSPEGWLVGPETGQKFGYRNFGGVEPNNAGYVYINLGAGFSDIGTGLWADDQDGNPSAGGYDPVTGYIIEYEFANFSSECNESADTIKNEIIDGEYSDRLLLVLGPSEALSSGSKIAGSNIFPRVRITVKKPACFFFIDLVPIGMYGHKVLYVLTDRETGKITHREWAASPPLITDPKRNKGKPTAYYETIEDRVTSQDRVFPKDQDDYKRPLIDAPIQPSFAGPVTAMSGQTPRPFKLAESLFRKIDFKSTRKLDTPPCKKTRKIALLVNGGKDKAFGSGLVKMLTIMSQLGFDKIVERSWQLYSLAEIRESIQDLTEDLGDCDVFVIYIHAHALAYDIQGGNMIMGGSVTDGEILYHHGLTPTGTLNAWSLSNRVVNASKAAGGADTGPGLLYSLRDVNAGFIQIVLDMCNSGLLIDAATGRSPTLYGPPISQFLSKNQKLSILTAAARNQSSLFHTKTDLSFWLGFIGKGDAYDKGGLFTQIFVAEFWDQIRGNDVDSNSDRTIDRSEYDLASKEAMSETKEQFSGWFDKLRQRSHDPQSIEIAGTAP